MKRKLELGLVACGLVLTCSCVRTIAVKPIEVKPVQVTTVDGKTAAGGEPGRISEVKTPPAPLDGIVFYLPKTVLDITVETKVEKSIPGLYCQYQKLFFSDEVKGIACPAGWKSDISKLDDAIPAKASVAGVTMASHGVPDTAKPFMVPIGGATVDTSDSFEFKENGILVGVESTRTDRKLDLALSILKFGAGLAGRFVGGAGSPVPDTDKFCGKAKLKDDDKDKEKNPRVLFACQFMAMNHEAATSVWLNLQRLDSSVVDSLLAEWSGCKDDLCSGLDITKRPWLLMQAREKYQRYGSLLEVSAGSTADDIKIGQDRAKSLLESYFTGKKTPTPWIPAFEVTPGKPAGVGTKMGYALFKKGDGCFWYDGFAKEVFLRQNPMPKELSCKADPGPGAEVSLNVEEAKESGYEQLPRIFKSHFTQPTNASYPFNIPLEVSLNLEAPGTKCPECRDLLPARLMLAQWGEQYALPVGASSKGKNIKVSYFEATGALKTVKIGSDAFDAKSLVGGLSDATSGILDAKKKADDAAAEPTELQRLTKQRMILEEKAKIALYCAQLGLSCN